MADNARAVRGRLGRTVRRLRQARGWSQERLAEESGITTKYISLVELGKINATLDKLTGIANGLSISLSELFMLAGSRRPAARSYVLVQSDFDQLESIAQLVARLKRTRAPRRRPAKA